MSTPPASSTADTDSPASLRVAKKLDVPKHTFVGRCACKSWLMVPLPVLPLATGPVVSCPDCQTWWQAMFMGHTLVIRQIASGYTRGRS